MKKYKNNNIELINGDCIAGMSDIADNSIDVVLTDPPYLFLEDQKLDRPFDEQKYFNEVKRVLKDSGFIVIFGRGKSFYMWNTILADLGFQFKEEIIWDKRFTSSPVLPIGRVHETVAILTKKNGIIRKNKIPYLEQKQFNIESILTDFKRVNSILHNQKELQRVIDFIENKQMIYLDCKRINNKNNLTIKSDTLNKPHTIVEFLHGMINGQNEKSIIQINRSVRHKYHPTQKPVRLMERLLQLVCPSGADVTVLDTFAGSCPLGIACQNTGRKFIGFEIDEEYYNNAIIRIEAEGSNQIQIEGVK